MRSDSVSKNKFCPSKNMQYFKSIAKSPIYRIKKAHPVPKHTYLKNVLTFQSKHEDVFIQTNVRFTSNKRLFFAYRQLPHIHPFFRSEVKRIGRSDVERIVPGLDVRQGTVYTPSAQ